jgi:serine/threonine protein kinase
VADDHGKPPVDDGETILADDLADVTQPGTSTRSGARESRSAIESNDSGLAATQILDERDEEGDANDDLGGEAETVAIDNQAAGDHAAREAERSRVLGADAPTEYEGAVVEEEESPPELAPGTVLFGEYEVGERIGAGGMGEVYRARHRRLGEDRAIKMIRPIYTADKAAARLFDREARSLLKIHHPAVVRCHDMLSDESGRVYLVMEFVEGHSLAEHLLDGPLKPKQVEKLAARLASGLASAHSEGVVHRDLSPDNVVLPGGSFASAKLIDFGIAKEVERTETTILDGFKGKVLYASPEQIGYFDGEVDRRSDYFSLALVLACAALGRPLAMGGSLIQAVEARRQTPPLPREMPDSVRRMIEPLLAVDPSHRPDSLDALMPRSQEAVAGAPAAASGGRGVAALLGGLGAVAATVGGLWLWETQTSESIQSTLPTEAVAASVDPSPAGSPVATQIPEPPGVAGLPTPVAKEPDPPAPKAQPKPVVRAAAKPKGPSASDRAASLRRELRIEGLIAGARAALADGRLTSPPGDNAVEKLETALKLDPSNAEARSSMNAVGGRYLEMADAAIESGDVETAGGYIETAAQVAPAHPALRDSRAALAGAQ